ncbi:hypothetical protein PN36_24870 [Candidatus Thiomargarita nelsonii]|uniref:Uncharacterized protein n=1 Tax=Candidatus Thiomargarita nelsonii TaxID=1003181 RepID=A0A4E0QQY8_9GAMM|nr:hypothetical protein PN36_24870 [Candidatus Thiomargarita nelsonii]
MGLIKQGIGMGLALGILVSCATTTDDPSQETSLWGAMVNTTTGKYDERTKRLEDELEQSKLEREQAEKERQRLKAEKQ